MILLPEILVRLLNEDKLCHNLNFLANATRKIPTRYLELKATATQ
jgi:hypothetical protein